MCVINNIIVIPILFCSLGLNAQIISRKPFEVKNLYIPEQPVTRKDNLKNSFLKTGLMLTQIAAKATGDALKEEHDTKAWGHVLNGVADASWLAYGLWTFQERDEWHHDVISYICMRFGAYDYFYNAARGVPLGYYGNTSYYDKFMRNRNFSNGIDHVFKGVFLIGGISVNF